MIFPLHFKKVNVIVLIIIFPISFLIPIYHPPLFVYSFGLMLDSQEYVRSTVSSRLDSDDAGGDDGLIAEWTWELVTLSPEKKVIGCKWVHTVKLNPYEYVARLKARLIVKGYSKVYELDFVDTFSPVVKMTSVWVLVPLAMTYHWPLHQLDIKNVFLNGILDEFTWSNHRVLLLRGCAKVCRLKSLYDQIQSPRAWFGHFASVMQEFDLYRAQKDHSAFWQIQDGKRILLIVYVDDIMITRDNTKGIDSL